MYRALILGALLLLGAASRPALAVQTPTGVVSLTGDQSVVLHWEPVVGPSPAGYRVYRSTTGPTGPFALQTSSLLTIAGFCDLSPQVINGQTNSYYVTAVDSSLNESLPSVTLAAIPHAFASTNEFLDYVQETSFDYFWYGANPANGLIPDRSPSVSYCSIAAVGFGLTAIGIGVDHGWITRTQATARVLTTLNTFLNGPQGPGTSGIIGYQGWFYHFLDMNTALRASDELSSIDTVLLLGGILYAKQYFNGASADETSIRTMADAIFNRVNWTFFSPDTNAVRMGWLPGSGPGSGFSSYGNWVGYNEAMLLYILGLGTATNPLPASGWSKWTSGYTWATAYGQTYVLFPSMYGHQYSHCWIDFRHIADAFMNSHNCTYFENSRRAALSQVAYCSTAPHAAYSSTIWGLTACDGPGFLPYQGYSFRGLPPALDDGTIAPTAAGGSICFTPEYSIPTLQAFYSRARSRIWTSYGFRDAFNVQANAWYDTDELGIDEGPIVIMIENYRTQRVWELFMQNAEVQRGLQRAGFVPLPFVALQPQALPAQGAFELTWNAMAGRPYQVEYSPDLFTWDISPGFVQATNSGPLAWLDTRPPGTVSAPSSTPQRFYRVLQIGSP